ncbi:MAG: aldehyde-activating protein [Rhodovulum sulfidophilum]|uniref:Aldehyde-activating protein n=1 Tax=Rhodovulum sulfidophilum TaxID=35806 RepID=A0A2W5NGB4_RHOSU|nr:MAG: aldehyde-activating protein [Rhodovulum sulfidophilum]
MEMKGHCLCGAVAFEAEVADGTEAHACHCSMCRRWVGGPNLSVEIAPDAIRFVEGAPIATRASSDWAERAWCADCGSTLFYRLTDGPKAGWLYLALGLLDDPSLVRLGGEIYIDAKPDCYALAGDHFRMTGAEFEAAMAASDH